MFTRCSNHGKEKLHYQCRSVVLLHRLRKLNLAEVDIMC